MELGLKCDALKGSLSKVELGMMLWEEPLSMTTLASIWSIHLTDHMKGFVVSPVFDGYLFIGESEVVVGHDVIDYTPETLHRYVLCYMGFIQNLDQ